MSKESTRGRPLALRVDTNQPRVRQSAAMRLWKRDERLYGRARLALLLCTALCGLALLTVGCGGSLYRVKPVVSGPITATSGSNTVEADGIRLTAVPLLSDEESQELFEANLPLAGLLPVRVELTNTGDAPLALKKRLRFRLTDEAGKSWKLRNAKQAVSRILKSNQVTLYNPNSRAAFEAAFRQHTFDLETPLAPGEARRGLIFFQTPKKQPVESPHGLTLRLEGSAQPLLLRFN